MSEVNMGAIYMWVMYKTAERSNLAIFLVIILNIDYFIAWLPRRIFHTGTQL